MKSLTLVFVVVCLFAILGGCRTRTVETSSVEQATSLITQTLESWKTGAELDSLRTTEPPVYVSDDAWFKGVKLKEYKLVQTGEQFGSNVRFSVELTLESSKKCIVSYLVTTTPACTVARQDR